MDQGCVKAHKIIQMPYSIGHWYVKFTRLLYHGCTAWNLIRVKHVVNISGRIRQVHGEATEIKIMYEDQAYNDFNSLFLVLGGKIDWRIRVQTNLVIS